MVMQQKKEENIIVTSLIGAVALVLLLLVVGLYDFSNWFFDRIAWYFISSFFIMPVISKVVFWKKRDFEFVPAVLGLSGLTIYSLIIGLSLKEIAIYSLEAVIAISIFFIISSWFMERMR